MSVMPKMATNKNPSISKRSARILKSNGRRIRLTKSVARKWAIIMESPGYRGWSNSEFAEHLLLSAINKTSKEASSTSTFEGEMTTIHLKDSVLKKWRDFMMVSGFNLSTDSEFAEALLNSLDARKKAVRAQVASSSFPSSATSSSAATSTLHDAKNQNQIFINVDILGTDADQSSASEGSSATATGHPVPKVIVTSFNPKADSFEAAFLKAVKSQSSARCKLPDANQLSASEGSSATATGHPVPKVIVTSFDPKADSFEAAFLKAVKSQSSTRCRLPDANQLSVSEGSSATATGHPVPKVIVTSFDPKADSFEAAFSKAAESQSSAAKVSSEDNRRTNSNDPEVVDLENNCDVANSKASSWSESTGSCGSSSDREVVEVNAVSPPKRKREVCADALLADLTGAFVDPLGEETLFGAVLTNYKNKLCQVEGSLEKIKQEKENGETALKMKTAKEKLLTKELDALRKEISGEKRHLEELQKKKELMFTEKRSLENKVLHCETLKSEHESKKARLK